MSIKYASQYERMTTAPVGRLTIGLAIPTTISMLVTAVYNLVDTYFVGLLGSTSASGAVGVVFTFMALQQAVGFMFGQGSGSLVSRLLGSKNKEKASTIVSTGFFMAIATGLIIFTVGTVFRHDMIYLFGSTDTIYPYAEQYFTYLLWASPFTVSGFVLNNVLRYEGKAKLAMIGLLSGSIINIGLDPLFMFTFDMGMAGAALATSIAQVISFSILLFMFLSGHTESRISIKRFTRDIRDIAEICGTGLPSLIRQGLGSISGMMLNNAAKVYDDAAVAAMSIVNRISMLIFSAGLGIGQGFQPVCGYNYGAKKFDRVRKAYFFTLKVAFVMLGVFATLGLVFAEGAVGLFRDDPDVTAIGTDALRFQCISLYVIPIMVTTNMLLQSSGQKLAASFTAMLRNGIYYIPLLLILSNTVGLKGIQMTQMTADLLSVATCIPIAGNFLHRLKILDEKKE
ncbi:MAG: MATE family efflux transporter [Lachnospiraceae bacterium]|jgi:putative MATE family efflux protein|nr:MATE family efflux transporter [Lachnospiraceae bacterium]